MHISNFWVKNFSECFTALYLYVRLSCQPGTLFRLFGIFCIPFYWYKVAKTEYNWNSRRWRTIPHHFQLPSRFLSLKQKQMHTDDILNLYPLFLSFFFDCKINKQFSVQSLLLYHIVWLIGEQAEKKRYISLASRCCCLSLFSTCSICSQTEQISELAEKNNKFFLDGINLNDS